MQVFAESGFRGGTIRDIAERVGISQAGLLHHFSSKNELLESVLTHRDDAALERMGGDPLDRSLPPGLELLHGFVDMMSFNATTPGLVALYTVLSSEATAAEHPAHDYFLARYGFVCGALREALEYAQARGEVRHDVDCAAAARTLVAISDGLQVQWLYDDGELDMAEDARAYLQTLLTETATATATPHLDGRT